MVLEDGRIVSDVFDRMSLLRFLETRFGTTAPNLTMAANDVGDLTSTLDVDRASPSVPLLPCPLFWDARVRVGPVRR